MQEYESLGAFKYKVLNVLHNQVLTQEEDDLASEGLISVTAHKGLWTQVNFDQVKVLDHEFGRFREV